MLLLIARHYHTCIMSLMKILMVMVAVSLGCVSADCVSSFDAVNRTTEAYLGDNLTFECSTERAIATVFQGDLLDCIVTFNEIVLLHSRFSNTSATASGICNNGKVHGHSLPINDSEPCYTSQLHVTVSPDMIGKRIICAYDNGTTAKEIGNYLIEQYHATTVTTIALSTATIIHENNTESSTTMHMHNKAVKLLSSGKSIAIVLCCSAIVVGIMITIIILLTRGFILKKKQLQIIQIPNSTHNIIHEESTSTSTANVGQQQSQATFHCALNDEVSGYTLCTTDYDCVAIVTDDSEYDRLQHPGGQHAPHRMESRAHLQLTHMQL